MLISEEQKFSSLVELREYLANCGREQGYGMVTYKSVPGKWAVLGCSRGKKNRALPNDTQGPKTVAKRKGASLKIDCPYKIRCVAQNEQQWTIKVICWEHNHAPANDPRTLPVNRRLANEQKTQVQEHLSSGFKSKEIRNILKKECGVEVLSQDIDNHRKRMLKEDSLGAPFMQALFENLKASNKYLYQYRTIAGRLDSLFLLHNTSEKALNHWSTILVMDSTFNTNRHKMPLFNIAGISSTR